jgi:hypothetical protein
MSEALARKSTARTVLAVIAGLLTVVALDLSVDAVMHAKGVFPPLGTPMSDKQSLLAISYRLLDGIIGGYVAAWLAPNRPLRHAVILGSIGTLVALVGAMATWNMNLGPHWYALAIAVAALPAAAFGGMVRERQRSGNSSAERA